MIGPPSVTVILTVYKRTEYLHACIDSILSQSYQDFELIIADDSDSINIENIVKQYIHDGINIFYRSNKAHLGVALSIKKVILNSKSDYIVIVNDDDFWGNELLEELISPLEKNKKIIASFSDHWIVDQSGVINSKLTYDISKKYGRLNLKAGKIKDKIKFIVKNRLPVAMATMIRRQSVDWTRLNNQIAGAYDLWISYAIGASKGDIYYINRRLSFYRVHYAMETKRRSSHRNKDLIYIYRQLANEEAYTEYRDYFNTQQSLALYNVSRDYYREEKYYSALYFLFKSLKVNKLNFKAIIFIAIIKIKQCFI